MTTVMNKTFQIKAGDLQFTFLNSGDLFEITHNTAMINQLLANPIDGSPNNLYLRIYDPAGIKAVPLLGVHSNGLVSYTDTQVRWRGDFDDIQYQVTFSLSPEGIWFWDVSIEGSHVEVDVIYGQDLGLADKGAVRSNEAFMSQYIDHTIFEHNQYGYTVCSRQNQPQQGGAFPYIQQGALTKAISYSTDGFQFFGLSYKETNHPEALSKNYLANEVYQYEFAYTALQSERILLNGSARFVFYGVFKENHPEAITTLEYEKEITSAWAQIATFQSGQAIERVSLSPILGEPLQTESMNQAELNTFFPSRHEEEWDGDTLLSFFTDTHEHIVLKEKELLVERPHGLILMSGDNVNRKENVATTTSYMYGVFNSQLLVGNTSFHKMLTNTRNPLNVMKTSGQRIYVELDGRYHLLTMPSMFEMGFNYVRWYYKTKTETWMITNYTTVDSAEINLHVTSNSGKSYRYLITNQVSMNNNEYEVPFILEQNGDTLTFKASDQADSANIFPELRYVMRVKGADVSVSDEKTLVPHAAENSASLVVLELSPTQDWSMSILGLLHGEKADFTDGDSQEEIEKYREFYRMVLNGFELKQNGVITNTLKKVNDLAWWYTHNMLVHYSVPHGLEQYGGAAWGTRDVCQGPTEYFMATQKYEVVREILKTVYSHQYEDSGNWPQWFMFDRYFSIQQEDSHGDIIVWPLKVLADYLAQTHDFSILQETVPYTNHHTFQFTEEKATIFDHAKKEIDYIKKHFLHDTHLSSYGDGDWDDTLQPANAQLKQYMVSSWTVALTYQVFKQLAHSLEDVEKDAAHEMSQLAKGIEADYHKYMLQTGVVPGFVYLEDPEHPELMLHPSDTKTGIQYRLLPMKRGIISELLSPEEAATHYQLIKEHLYFPDGVRLMNRPAKYEGGVSSNFKRAEQASNFGREIGLQYVHAHIRFAEAMAKLGNADELWRALEIINPVGIQKAVRNAERRQSNVYFSSSDGQFATRYEADRRFEELRKGTVKVKGGWRIYSSGPGIYMNQLITNSLGIRLEKGNLVIDPVIPVELDGLEFQFMIFDKPVTFTYHIQGQKVSKLVVNGQNATIYEMGNRYRSTGATILKEILESLLQSTSNHIEIFMS